jgi:riboflavin transporter FmnP
MTDAYIPVAANSTNLMELFNNSYYTTAPLSSEQVFFLCPIIATILVLIIMVILVVLYAIPCGGVCGLKTRGKTGIKNQHKATIVAFSIISFNRIVIFIVYDILALQLRYIRVRTRRWQHCVNSANKCMTHRQFCSYLIFLQVDFLFY